MPNANYLDGTGLDLELKAYLWCRTVEESFGRHSASIICQTIPFCAAEVVPWPSR